MSILTAIILGIVQGRTEFLPVSSSGHLMVTRHLFGLENNMLLFDILLHIASLLAVLIIFRKKIFDLLLHPKKNTSMIIALVIATVISCAMVLVLEFALNVGEMKYKFLPITFSITAVVLVVATVLTRRNDKKNAQNVSSEEAESVPMQVSKKQAIATGIAQGVACLPGISRSGSTISAALATGMKRSDAAEFSFIMSIPIIIASFLYELVSSDSGSWDFEFLPILCGFIASFISAIFAIKIMLVIIKRVQLYWFSVYLVLLVIAMLFIFPHFV